MEYSKNISKILYYADSRCRADFFPSQPNEYVHVDCDSSESVTVTVGQVVSHLSVCGDPPPGQARALEVTEEKREKEL